MYFNSIKVQLELRKFVMTIIHIAKFQFHKGTIRTAQVTSWNIVRDRFQFHKGTIRTHLSCYTQDGRHQFQFHKGTIRTLLFNIIF